MGQKVNPHGLRIGIIKDWDTKWYANSKDFSNFLVEDVKIRKYLKKKLYIAGIAELKLSVLRTRLRLTFIHQPGIVIGKQGSGIEALRKS